jgi:hypothetical protein
VQIHGLAPGQGLTYQALFLFPIHKACHRSGLGVRWGMVGPDAVLSLLSGPGVDDHAALVVADVDDLVSDHDLFDGLSAENRSNVLPFNPLGICHA